MSEIGEVIPLRFLADKEHRSLIVRDTAEKPDAVQVESAASRAADVIKLDLAAGGGFIARFSPAVR